MGFFFFKKKKKEKKKTGGGGVNPPPPPDRQELMIPLFYQDLKIELLRSMFGAAISEILRQQNIT